MQSSLRTAQTKVINNVQVVTEESIIGAGSVVIEYGRIEAIHSGNSKKGDVTYDGRGCWMLPGFVDIHGDSLENAIAPRPAAPFPLQYILPSFDAELTAHGITTMYYCLAMADLGETLTKPLRRREQVKSIIEALNFFRPQARIRTNIHLRYEILDVESLESLCELVKSREVDLLSIMDHTPGHGVFKNIEAYREYRKRSGGTLAEADEEMHKRFSLREKVDMQKVENLIRLCHDQGIVTASHDDHTKEKVQQAKEMGIEVAEFPVNREAAIAARELGMDTVFGAANLVRDQSHAGNVLASDMIRQGLCSIICSDYSPMAMLQGLFKIKEQSDIPFPELVALFSLNPARAVGIAHETGSIQEGKRADLVLVAKKNHPPRVVATFVAGEPVFSSNDLY